MEENQEIKLETKGKFEKFIEKYGTPVAILLGMSIIAVAIYLSFGLPNARRAADSSAKASDASGTVQAKVNVSADDDPVLGNQNARVTLIEFSLS